MWMGISTTLITLMLYAKEKNPQFAVSKTLLAAVLLVSIMITGHLGGSLTHGSDYITKPLKNIFSIDTEAVATIKPIANVQDAMVYTDVIKPIFETKCYSCHGTNKQKGGLRMDDSLKLMKGGKDGVVIAPGNADASKLIKRLLLPTDNDDHMPPKEKPQPSESQLALLHWWITNGAAFNTQVKDLPQDEKIKPMLFALQTVNTETKQLSYIPAKPVEPANAHIVQQLNQKNILVLPVALNSNYLEVNFINDTLVNEPDLQLVAQLNKQLISLKLSGSNANDDLLSTVAKCSNLIRLYLDGTNITDKGLAKIVSLSNLQYLNLTHTNVTAHGLLQLKPLQDLQAVYLYQTKITQADWASLQQTFPKTVLDSGGYIVPTLTTDTTEVKVKKEY